jgi:hypothetical protein
VGQFITQFKGISLSPHTKGGAPHVRRFSVCTSSIAKKHFTDDERDYILCCCMLFLYACIHIVYVCIYIHCYVCIWHTLYHQAARRTERCLHSCAITRLFGRREMQRLSSKLYRIQQYRRPRLLQNNLHFRRQSRPQLCINVYLQA